MGKPLVSHAKPAEERAGHHAPPSALEAPQRELVAPDPPEGLILDGELARRWRAVWTSPVAQVLDPVSDLEPMARLFKLYRRDAQFDKALDRQLEWLADSHEGMPFDPQFARVRLAIAAEIRQLEQTLGITPRGRLVIGAAVMAASKAAGAQDGEGAHDDADD